MKSSPRLRAACMRSYQALSSLACSLRLNWCPCSLSLCLTLYDQSIVSLHASVARAAVRIENAAAPPK